MLPDDTRFPAFAGGFEEFTELARALRLQARGNELSGISWNPVLGTQLILSAEEGEVRGKYCADIFTVVAPAVMSEGDTETLETLKLGLNDERALTIFGKAHHPEKSSSYRTVVYDLTNQAGKFALQSVDKP